MKLDGRPDDLTLNPLAWGTVNAGVNMLAGGGLVLVRAEANLPNATYVSAGLVRNVTFAVLSPSNFENMVILQAFTGVKGFTGGSGSIDVSLGISGPDYNDLVLEATATTGAADIVRGVTVAQRGSRLVDGGGLPEFNHNSSGPSFTLQVDCSSFTGTPTAGRLFAAILLLPLDGYNFTS